MNSEFPQPSLKKINKNFEQNHKNLFENIKVFLLIIFSYQPHIQRVYHPNQAAKEFEIVRSFSKRNLNIKANQNLNKQELQRSPNIKSPNRSKEKNLQQFSLLFTPSPVKFKNQSCFRKELTTYHNNFAENLNHNLLIPNSYSKLFLEKEISYRNCSNIAKNRSEANLLNKSQAMAKDFCYHDDNNYLSNTNLTGQYFFKKQTYFN